LDGSAISGNTAAENGGGLHCGGGAGIVAVDALVTVSLNSATDNGGGFYADQCQVFSFASLPGGIWGNNAGENGGGGYVAGGAAFTMIGGEGGFGFGDADSLGTLDNNRADTSGGGVYVINAGSSVEITDSQLSFNFADADQDDSGEGGGIRLTAGTSLTMDRTLPGRSCAVSDQCSSLVGNGAQRGGGIYASGNGVSVDIRQTYITLNEADGVATGVFVSNNGGDPAQPGTLYMEGNVIADNPTSTTDTFGLQGVVDLQSNTQATIANTTFANNLTGYSRKSCWR
jgi:predicted outer membrane repeat protein